MTEHVINHYLCPECGTDWADTWECACNSECPACGIKDIEPLDRSPEDCCDMEMAMAFETVLQMARSYSDGRAGALTEENKVALGLVTAFYLLKVKG